MLMLADAGVTYTVFLWVHRLDFIYDLFEKVGSRNNEEKMGTARRKPTVSSQFRVSDAFKWHILLYAKPPKTNKRS